MIRRLAVLAAFAALLATAACRTVKPWERGRLVSRCMVNDVDPLETAFTSHVHNTRESIQGAASGGGASCGCN